MAGKDYAALAERVTKSLKRVSVSGAGYISTLIQPGLEYGADSDPIFGPDILTEIIILDFEQKQRNRDGTLTEISMRTLTISTEGLGSVVPSKNDRVAIGIRSADVTDTTERHKIGEVRPLAPAGVVVLYEADLVK